MSQNGTGKKAWNLSKDGLLWKRVLENTTKEFQDQGRAFVTQLQESVQPVGALQGLLLDRIAAGQLRKQLMLEVEAGRRYLKAKPTSEPAGSISKIQKLVVVAGPFQEASNVLKYEALLDQGFHRDFSLLLQLQEAAPATPALGAKKPGKVDGNVIEGEIAKPHAT